MREKWEKMEADAAVVGWLGGVEERVGRRWWRRDERRKASLGAQVVEGNFGVRHEVVRGRRKWSGGKW